MLIAQNHSATKQIFHHGHSTVHARFVQAIVVKQGNLFLLYLRDGDILTPSEQGLYFHDMRYLSLQTLRLNGSQLVSRQASVSECANAAFDLTNPDLLDAAGNRCVRKETLGIQRRKCLGGTYTETLTIHNYTWEPAVFTLTLHYEADFVDMFVVQGATPTKRGTLHEPQWQESTLCFRYDGADGRTRSTTIAALAAQDQL
jgi:glycogen debranching enzyme